VRVARGAAKTTDMQARRSEGQDGVLEQAGRRLLGPAASDRMPIGGLWLTTCACNLHWYISAVAYPPEDLA
jgi:hypothetical protein